MCCLLLALAAVSANGATPGRLSIDPAEVRIVGSEHTVQLVVGGTLRREL